MPVGHITNGIHVPAWDSAEADEVWTRACGKGRWLGTLDAVDQNVRQLYYRLAVFPIHLPALRERGEDVLLLADYFVRTLGAKMGRQEPGLSSDARELLLAHSWPGNIRELQTAIERAFILALGQLISAEHLGIVPRAPRSVSVPIAGVPETEAPATALTIGEQEKRMIAEALRRTSGNKARAAALLGVSRTQLLRRIRRFGLNV